MEKTQSFTIRQKLTGRKIGTISVDNRGNIRQMPDTAPASAEDAQYGQDALERIIAGCCDSFGRIYLFVDKGGKVSVTDGGGCLIPGKNDSKTITDSIRLYMKLIGDVYDIKEETATETSTDHAESTSSTKLLVKDARGQLIGEICARNGGIVTTAQTQEDEDFLFNLVRNAWRVQAGIPIVAKEGDKFKTNKDGKFTVSKYVNFGNAPADEVLKAFADYTNMGDQFSVEINAI